LEGLQSSDVYDAEIVDDHYIALDSLYPIRIYYNRRRVENGL
jgi:hypothetical protein